MCVNFSWNGASEHVHCLIKVAKNSNCIFQAKHLRNNMNDEKQDYATTYNVVLYMYRYMIKLQ